MPLTASFPGKTACKPSVKISALIADFILAHLLKESEELGRREFLRGDRDKAEHYMVSIARCHVARSMFPFIPK